jgi:hypothetical protein
METAEQTIRKYASDYVGSNMEDFVIPVHMVITLMKQYGFEVAKNALDSAAKKYDNVHMKDSWGCTCDVPNAIRTTPIELR